MGPLLLTPLAPVAMIVSVVTLRPVRALRVATGLVRQALSSNVFMAVLDPAEWFRETFAA